MPASDGPWPGMTGAVQTARPQADHCLRRRLDMRRSGRLEPGHGNSGNRV